ncbi:MAG: cupin domain-containing protein [Phycisphaerales bacterium]
MAAVSRLRGTGRGVSCTRLFDALERDHPLRLEAPFEGSDRVSGAVWRGDQVLGGPSTAAVARLLWAAEARDLPMHVHDHSDRFIVVRHGRGYFHVTDESCDEFCGGAVRSIPARERDVFLFTRGVVHTFSTDSEPMELLSCQLPFVPFDQPEQYRVPACRWTAATHRDGYAAEIACDAAWTVLARQPVSNVIAAGMVPLAGS